MDIEQMRRETERLQAECANTLAKDQLYRLKRTWLREAWDELRMPLLLVGLLFFVGLPAMLLFMMGLLKFAHWLKP